MKGAFATVVTSRDTAAVQTNFVNTDIDGDGLWDIRMRIKRTDPYKTEIELSYTDVNNYVAIKVNSAQDITPITYNKNIDINAAGIWVNSTDGYLFINNLSDFPSTSKYLGIRIVKNNINYCAWVQVFFENRGILYRGTYAWENNKTKCVKTGIESNTSSVSRINALDRMSVYPNPVNNNQIYFNGLNETNNSITVFNLIGEIVMTIKNAKNNLPIDVSNLSKGFYIFRIEDSLNEYNTIKVSIN